MFILLLFIVRLTQSQRDYSMIVATRPDPTVRPPSRTLGNALRMFFVDFPTYFSPYSSFFLYIFVIIKNFRAKIEPLAKCYFSL